MLLVIAGGWGLLVVGRGLMVSGLDVTGRIGKLLGRGLDVAGRGGVAGRGLVAGPAGPTMPGLLGLPGCLTTLA